MSVPADLALAAALVAMAALFGVAWVGVPYWVYRDAGRRVRARFGR